MVEERILHWSVYLQFWKKSLKYFKRFIIYLYVCICIFVSIRHMCTLGGQKRLLDWFSGAGVANDWMWATWCACRAPDSGPWEEPEVLSITEPFLQPLFKIFVRIRSFVYFVYWGPLVAVIGESVGVSSLLWLCRSCRTNSIDQAWQQCFYPRRHLIGWKNKLWRSFNFWISFEKFILWDKMPVGYFPVKL